MLYHFCQLNIHACFEGSEVIFLCILKLSQIYQNHLGETFSVHNPGFLLEILTPQVRVYANLSVFIARILYDSDTIRQQSVKHWSLMCICKTFEYIIKKRLEEKLFIKNI